MIDNKTKEDQIAIALDDVADQLHSTLSDCVEKRKNLSLRISESRHDTYKELADVHRILFDKTVPLGSLGDLLVDQLNETLVSFLAKNIFQNMHRGWKVSLVKAGFSIDLVTFKCCHQDGRRLALYDMKRVIESIIDSAIELLGLDLSYLIKDQIKGAATKLALQKIARDRENCLFAIQEYRTDFESNSIWTIKEGTQITSTFENGKRIYIADTTRVETDIN